MAPPQMPPMWRTHSSSIGRSRELVGFDRLDEQADRETVDLADWKLPSSFLCPQGRDRLVPGYRQSAPRVHGQVRLAGNNSCSAEICPTNIGTIITFPSGIRNGLCRSGKRTRNCSIWTSSQSRSSIREASRTRDAIPGGSATNFASLKLIYIRCRFEGLIPPI